MFVPNWFGDNVEVELVIKLGYFTLAVAANEHRGGGFCKYI